MIWQRDLGETTQGGEPRRKSCSLAEGNLVVIFLCVGSIAAFRKWFTVLSGRGFCSVSSTATLGACEALERFDLFVCRDGRTEAGAVDRQCGHAQHSVSCLADVAAAHRDVGPGGGGQEYEECLWRNGGRHGGMQAE